jgi:hypothetical protein
MTYNKITIVAQILLQNTLIKHENINVFEGNQGYFHPFIDPERGGWFLSRETSMKAKASVTDQDIRKTWILFGDPTTRLK